MGGKNGIVLPTLHGTDFPHGPSLPLRGTQDPEGSVREAAPRRQGLTPPVVPSNVEKPGSMEVCSWENWGL